MGMEPNARLAYGYDIVGRDEWTWDAVEALGLEKVYYGGDEAGFVLAAKVVEVVWGRVPVDLAGLVNPDTLAAYDERLAHGLDALDITPPQEKPSWLLAAYYG